MLNKKSRKSIYEFPKLSIELIKNKKELIKYLNTISYEYNFGILCCVKTFDDLYWWNEADNNLNDFFESVYEIYEYDLEMLEVLENAKLCASTYWLEKTYQNIKFRLDYKISENSKIHSIFENPANIINFINISFDCLNKYKMFNYDSKDQEITRQLRTVFEYYGFDKDEKVILDCIKKTKNKMNMTTYINPCVYTKNIELLNYIKEENNDLYRSLKLNIKETTNKKEVNNREQIQLELID